MILSVVVLFLLFVIVKSNNSWFVYSLGLVVFVYFVFVLILMLELGNLMILGVYIFEDINIFLGYRVGWVGCFVYSLD